VKMTQRKSRQSVIEPKDNNVSVRWSRPMTYFFLLRLSVSIFFFIYIDYLPVHVLFGF